VIIPDGALRRPAMTRAHITPSSDRGGAARLGVISSSDAVRHLETVVGTVEDPV
jgi:hypothetical protein